MRCSCGIDHGMPVPLGINCSKEPDEVPHAGPVFGPLASRDDSTAKKEVVRRAKARRAGDLLVIRNACVLTMDKAIGDFARADILVRGERIVAIEPDIVVDGAIEIHAEEMIALPGFIDTHRHSWQNVFRRFAPNATLETYGRAVDRLAEIIRPSDVEIGNLLSCYGALNSGVTTMLDWSHISNSPEHSDAAVSGLARSGIRAIYGFGNSRINKPGNRHPDDIARLMKQYFSSPDRLVTVCMAANIDRTFAWPLARKHGIRISAHVLFPDMLERAGDAGLLGPDITYIHCTTVTERGWKMIADTGGALSLALPSISQLGVGGGGIPPIQQALDHGIRPSLSVDVEVSLMGDFFTQMRTAFSFQRGMANQRRLAGEAGAPSLITARDVLEFATVEGALATGLSGKTGTLTPGKQADIILIRTNDIGTMPLNNAVGTVVLGADTSNVDMVMVAGELRKFDGALLDVDLDALKREVYASRDWLASEADYDMDLFGDGP